MANVKVADGQTGQKQYAPPPHLITDLGAFLCCVYLYQMPLYGSAQALGSSLSILFPCIILPFILKYSFMHENDQRFSQGIL